jgi:hypothetical protein
MGRRRVEKFIGTFFPRIAEVAQPPHHVKWRELNLGATLAGWNRLESAEAWLNTTRKKQSPKNVHTSNQPARRAQLRLPRKPIACSTNI